MNKPNSFVMLLRQKYRVYYNLQTKSWYVAYGCAKGRMRKGLEMKTRPEAEEAVEKLDEMLFGRTNLITPRELLWGDFAKMFLDFKVGKSLAPSSINRYGSALDAFGRHMKVWGGRYLHDVTLPLLEAYPAYRTKKEKCDVKTAYNDALVIKGALKWAAKPSRGLISVNPALDWETPEPVKPKRRCYTMEEVKAMEQGVRPWLRPVVVMLAWTGLRIGELINLRWLDVDLKKQLIHVRIRDDWRPKGKADRTVPMQPKVEAVIRQQRVGKLVFTGPRGGTIRETFALDCLKKDQRKMKMEVGDLHAFRRFFATSMMRAGVDADIVRQWGGWKSLETMLRYLADVKAEKSVEVMQEAARKLATF